MSLSLVATSRISSGSKSRVLFSSCHAITVGGRRHRCKSFIQFESIGYRVAKSRIFGFHLVDTLRRSHIANNNEFNSSAMNVWLVILPI